MPRDDHRTVELPVSIWTGVRDALRTFDHGRTHHVAIDAIRRAITGKYPVQLHTSDFIVTETDVVRLDTEGG